MSLVLFIQVDHLLLIKFCETILLLHPISSSIRTSSLPMIRMSWIYGASWISTGLFSAVRGLRGAFDVLLRRSPNFRNLHQNRHQECLQFHQFEHYWKLISSLCCRDFRLDNHFSYIRNIFRHEYISFPSVSLRRPFIGWYLTFPSSIGVVLEPLVERSPQNTAFPPLKIISICTASFAVSSNCIERSRQTSTLRLGWSPPTNLSHFSLPKISGRERISRGNSLTYAAADHACLHLFNSISTERSYLTGMNFMYCSNVAIVFRIAPDLLNANNRSKTFHSKRRATFVMTYSFEMVSPEAMMSSKAFLTS